jgi:uncharacterized SAM-binding protein YcdF (DUF218 family)
MVAHPRHFPLKRMLKFLIPTALLGLLWTGGAAALDRFGRAHEPVGQWDAIIVPGCRVWRGGVPSKALKRRVRRAADLFFQGYAKHLVLTGGVGSYPPAESIAASEYAEKLGVPRTAIRVETRSQNTIENARYARDVIGSKRVLVVTDAYHVLRCRLIFGRYFPEVHAVGVPLGKWPPVPESMREVLALGWHLVASGVTAIVSADE